MAETIKVLGQSSLAATTLSDVYTVGAGKSVSISSITVCNRGSSATTFRISVAVNGAADGNSQYLYYDQAIDAYSTFVATIGITLDAADVVRVYAGNGNLSVNIFGVEVQ